jgi:hypothetical protein
MGDKEAVKEMKKKKPQKYAKCILTLGKGRMFKTTRKVRCKFQTKFKRDVSAVASVPLPTHAHERVAIR